MPYVKEAFSLLGDVTILSPREITAQQVHDAELLLIRSTTPVGRALLEGSKVRFVGTATIGTDHMDIDYLEQAGIKWCSAPGCNANSVSEYLTAAILCLAKRHSFCLAGRTIGVIGIGNVGSLVVRKAEALGLRVLQNDPPKFDATGNIVYQPLERILQESDIITLHVPMTKEGKYPTFHMADDSFFKKLKHGCVFVNSARGAVMDSDALLRAMDKGIVAHSVLDTWEGEPAFRADVLRQSDIGTPHIAGHSFEGKVTGTVMVFREACRFLGVNPSWSPDSLLPEPVVPEINLDTADSNDDAILYALVRRVYDIEADDYNMRNAAVDDIKQRGLSFQQLRSSYSVRREFRFTHVTLKNSHPGLDNKVSGLGFTME